MDVSYHRGLVISCRSLSEGIKKEPTGQKPAGFCRFRLCGNLGAVLEFENQSSIGVGRYGVDYGQPEPVIKFGEGFITLGQFKHECSDLIGLCLAFCFPGQHRFQATLGRFVSVVYSTPSKVRFTVSLSPVAADWSVLFSHAASSDRLAGSA